MPVPAPSQPVTVETVRLMSQQLTAPAVPAADEPAVAGLLNGLAADMVEFRQFDVGDLEPVLMFDPTGGAA